MDSRRWVVAGTVPQVPLVLAALVIGLATGFGVGAYILVLFMPLLWAWSSNRLYAALTVSAYYLGASWPIAPAVADYKLYDSRLFGWGLLTLLLVVALSAIPWAILYRKTDQWLTTRLFAVAALTALPPLGLVQPAWPFLGAAFPFQGFGLAGIALSIVVLANAARRPILVILPLALSALWLMLTPPAVASATRFVAHQTAIPMAFYTLDFQRSYEALTDIGASLRFGSSDRSVHVLPESVGGLDAGATAPILSRPESVTMFVGGGEPQADTTLRSVFFEFSPAAPSGTTVYRQRVPIPFLSGESIKAFTAPVTERNGDKLGFLLCYEGFSAWAPLASGVAGANALVAGANLAFSALDEVMATSYTAHLNAWARLFGVPAVVAINHRPPTS